MTTPEEINKLTEDELNKLYHIVSDMVNTAKLNTVDPQDLSEAASFLETIAEARNQTREEAPQHTPFRRIGMPVQFDETK